MTDDYFLISNKWNKDFKTTAFPRFAMHGNVSTIRFQNCFYIAQAESEAFHIVNVSAGLAIETFKNAALHHFGHTNSFVFNGDNYSFAGVSGGDFNFRGIQ